MESPSHKGTINIETKRLILRKFKEDDYIAMFNNWASSKEVAKYMPWKAHDNNEVTKKLVLEWIDEYKKLDTYNWVIELKETNEIIGNISAPRKNDATLCCEIGYCLSEKCWGKGYMPEAFEAVMEYLFNTVGYNRIEGFHNVLNHKSGRVMEKVGMKCEGILREHGLQNDGNVCDSKIWSILKSEYVNKKKEF